MSELAITWVPGDEADKARGIAIVIDVFRAFTVAAYALAGGARAIWLVRTVEDAFALRGAAPDALLAGEVGGRQIQGFDCNNSPARMAAADVRDRLLIQRTGAGTQGAVGTTSATALLVASLVTARATAAYARRLAVALAEPVVTLVPTERNPAGVSDGMEDFVCADYLRALLLRRADAGVLLERGIARLEAMGRLNVFRQDDSDFPAADVPAALAVDRFRFAMVGERRVRDGVIFVEVRRVDVGLDVEPSA